MNSINWEAISAIADSLAVIGLIVSLLYVAKQIKQNNDAIRLNTDTAKVAAYHQAIAQVAASWMEPEFAILSEKYTKSPDSLSSEERSRLIVLWSATLFGHEIAFELYKKGQIDPSLWVNMLENNRALLTQTLPMQLLFARPGPLSKALFRELNEGIQQKTSIAEAPEIRTDSSI